MIARRIAGLRVLMPVLLISTIALTGCTDELSPSSNLESGAFESSVPNASKFRHTELLDRAVTKTAGKYGDESALSLVVGTSGTIGAQKVLERLKVLERYKVLERFHYEEVFKGIAITIYSGAGNDYHEILEHLISDPDVLWFEPDFNIETSPSSSVPVTGGQKIPWSIGAIGGDESKTQSGNGYGKVDVDIFVVDTGVNDYDLNVVEARYFGENGTSAKDTDGHGTHIAGIAAAEDDSDGIVGVAPGARVHNYRVLDGGYGDISVVLSAVEAIIQNYKKSPRPMVVNMSIGEFIGTEEYTALDYAVEKAIETGIVVVVAAGNFGAEANLTTPAHVVDAITVGSFGMNGSFSPFSNYGGRVDILAPGENIISLDHFGQLRSMAGTSMAAAHVTGAAALYLSGKPTAKPEEVLKALLVSSKPVITGTPSGTTDRMVWVGAPSLIVRPIDTTPILIGAPTVMTQ